MRSRKTVLAVDDNPLNLKIVEEILGSDYQLKCALNGADAIRQATRYAPAVVLLDVMMPEMDGLEICRRLRELPGLRNTFIVMVTAKAMPSERAAGISAGADEYITKPFDETELLALLRKYVDNPTVRCEQLFHESRTAAEPADCFGVLESI